MTILGPAHIAVLEFRVPIMVRKNQYGKIKVLGLPGLDSSMHLTEEEARDLGNAFLDACNDPLPTEDADDEDG
jgi:hypothetical protein